MSLRATLESQKNQADRRQAARKTLRLFVSHRRAGREAGAVLVHDLSVEGILIESAESVAIGETLAVQLPRNGLHEAVVVWSSSNFYGCRFDTPLPPGALSAAVLRALPAPKAEPSAPVAGEAPFSERLATLRRTRGWSVEQLADRLGVSRQSVWYWERGKRQPKPEMLSRIAKEFGVNPSELLEHPVDKDPSGDLHSWKKRLARQFGVSPENVRIMVEL